MAYRWRATTTDGAVHDGVGPLSAGGPPLAQLQRLEVWAPERYVLACSPERGERIRYFVRRRQAVGGTETLDMPVFELAHAGGWVRLYLHPDGPLLTASEVYA